jgi:hypothetical protein
MMKFDTPPFQFSNPNSFEGERQTFSNQLTEACLLYGVDVKYIDVSHNNVDNVFGEHLHHKLERGIPLRLITDQSEEDFYVEDTGMFSKFGYSPQLDTATFWGSVDYFKYLDILPQEDDLLYYPKVDKVFEITNITLLQDFKYKIDCKLYNYSHEEIADDVTDQPILNLEDINDTEVIKINTSLTNQVDDDYIDDSSQDGLYD